MVSILFALNAWLTRDIISSVYKPILTRMQ